MKHFILLLWLGLAPVSLWSQLLITEIADPQNDTQGRYIEIYNRSAFPVDLTNYKLVRWTNNNATYTASTAIDLSGIASLNPGQFLVVAANASSFSTLYGFTSDIAQGNGPADSNGNDQMAILEGETIIDIFGIPGEDGLNTCHDFTDGRVERKAHVLSSNPVFDQSEWNVWSNSSPSNCTSHVNGTQTAPTDFDPGDWIGENITTGDMTIANAAYFENLTLSPGSTLNILKTGHLTINSVLNNQGVLTMDSDSNEFSSLIAGSTSGNGTCTYNRWAASTATNDLIAAPFAGQTFNDFLNNNLGIINTNPNDTNQNLFGHFNNDNGAYENYSSSNTTILTSGVGYRVGTDLGATLAFQGQLATTDQTIPLAVGSDATSGLWNLIGNPYPSFIDMASFISENSNVLDPNYAAIYAYNGSGWTIYNSANSSGKMIAPGQGFFLASASAGGNVSFTKAMQRQSRNDDFISGETQEPDTFLKLNISNGNDMFSSAIYFNHNATLGMDVGYDTGLFAGQTPQLCLYTKLPAEDSDLNLAVQSIPKTWSDVAVIPLGVHALANTSVSIGLDSETVINSLYVYLEDTIENTWTNLDGNYYNFSPAYDLSGTGRFNLHISNQALTMAITAIDDFKITSAFDQITINGELIMGTQIQLYDLQGRNLLTKQVIASTNQMTIDTSRFLSGVYLIQIKNNRGAKTCKVVIH